MCFSNTNDRLLKLFTSKTKEKKNRHRICDNLCVEVLRDKANCQTCKGIMDQLLTSQFDWSTLAYNPTMDQFNPINWSTRWKLFKDPRGYLISGRNLWIKFLRNYILTIKIEDLMRLLALTLIVPLSGCDIPFVPFF